MTQRGSLRVATLTAVLIGVLVLPLISDAGVVGAEFRISGANATSHDFTPVVAYNSVSNEYLTVWSDGRNDATRGRDIYGRRVAADGTRVGADFRISGANATSDEWEPSVAYNSASNQFLVVWRDERNEATRGFDVYGRRLSSTGTRLGSDFRISGVNATSREHAPSVAYDSALNKYLVVWQDLRNEATRGSDIYGRRVAADGTRVGADFRISGTNATDREYVPVVVYNPTAGQFMVIWRDYRNEAVSGSDIYGRRLAADGSWIGADFKISGANATSYEYEPSITHNSALNQFLVVWDDSRNLVTRGIDIYGRRVAANGSRIGADFRICGTNATSNVSDPSVAYDSTTVEFVVVWNDYRNQVTRGSDIYGRRVAADGSWVGADFRISGINATSSENYPSVAYGSVADQYLAVWADFRDYALRGTDIYGRRISG